MKTKRKFNVKYVLIILGVILGIGCAYFVYLKRDVIVYEHPPVPLPHTRVKIADIEKTITLYTMNHNGKLPASLGELLEFASTQYDSKKKPLLKKEDLIDPWGEPFRYEPKGRRFTIISSGPDKIMGTEDDITN